MAEPQVRNRLERSMTLKAINQYMEDAEVDAEGELDLITFICTAQAIRPGVDTNELMQIYSHWEEEEETNENLAEQMHNLLQRVADSPTDADFERLTSIREVEDESDEIVVRHGRKMTVYEDAQYAAAEDLAQTEQKLMIAKEMLREGISPEMVASVTGLGIENLETLANENAPVSPRQRTQMSGEDIAQCLRLIDGGPEALAAEPELAHTLLVKMKDQLLSYAPPGALEDANAQEAVASPEGVVEVQPPLEPQQSIVRTTYEVTFNRKPLGMSWNQTSDGRNLYVQEVMENGAAAELGVQVGSLIYSFNGGQVFGLGPEQIYLAFKSCQLPLTVGFQTPPVSGETDPKVITLKNVTGLETETVIKLLHKFDGNVQAANEAFYIAKARTRQWISKQNKTAQQEQQTPAPVVSAQKTKKNKWWSNWVKKVR